MIDLIVCVSTFIFAVVTLALLTAPFETLRWWKQAEGDINELSFKAAPNYQVNSEEEVSKNSNFVVFLDGIAKADSTNYSYIDNFLQALARALPNNTIITDGMPYSVTNSDLTHDRPLSPLWRYAFQRKVAKPTDGIGFLINFRNMLQVLVSTDYRYGPIYNLGEAQQIVDQLLTSGYKLGSKQPLKLIGFSGGAQVAVGSATYLKRTLKVPVHIISIGGTYCADPALNDIEHFYNLRGSKDLVYKFTKLFFPRRWLLLRGTNWEKLVREARYTDIDVGPVRHIGENSYMGETKNAKDLVSRISSIVKSYNA